MPEKYFDKFNTITYANNVAINLMQRSALLTNVIQNPYLFYPYDIDNNERPDQISDSYYNDQYMSWVIYLSNGIIDPYYDWYLSEEEFTQFLLKKYQVTNIEELMQTIKFYRNNWYGAETISVSDYSSLIDQNYNLLKYWEPVYNGSYTPIHYRRAQKDWVIETNNVVIYTVVDAENLFKVGENVTINMGGTQSLSGNGQVASVSGDTVKVKHTNGYIIPEDLPQGYTYDMSLESKASLNSGSIDDYQIYLVDKGRGKDELGNTILDRLIPIDEIEYWSPVTIYDYENERNESNKSIRILNSSFAPQIAKELKDVMK